MDIFEGLRKLSIGRNLTIKPNKTEEERAAVRSYKAILRTIRIVLLIVAIGAVACTYTLFSSINSGASYSARRTGTVEGNNVRYVQGTMQYASLAELGIDKSTVTDGDKVDLYFNREDNLTGAQSTENTNTGVFASIAILIITIIIVIVFALFSRRVGRDFRQWYRSNHTYNY